MTHTLHRRGEEQDLREDYVMLIMYSKGINEDGAQEKFKQMWSVLEKHQADIVNFGNVTTGNSPLCAVRTIDAGDGTYICNQDGRIGDHGDIKNVRLYVPPDDATADRNRHDRKAVEARRDQANCAANLPVQPASVCRT